MLSVVETFKEFRSILWGAKINVYTDHKNLTQRNLLSNRILLWRMVLEEFAPTFHYKPGSEQIVADTLSRHPMLPRRGEQGAVLSEESAQFEIAFTECFLNYPEDVNAFPVTFANLEQHQQTDQTIQDNPQYQNQVFHGTTLKCYVKEDKIKIVLPTSLVDETIAWYHHILGHCGQERLYRSISTHLYAPNIQDKIAKYVQSCDSCQRNKNPGVGVGHLAQRNEIGLPWEEVAVDSIGPWKVPIQGFGDLIVNAISMIDTCTNIMELKRQETKTTAEAALLFENEWLSRYPRPLRVIHDLGKEFAGASFQSTLIINGIKPCPTTVKNPQANDICERVHQTVANAIRAEILATPPVNVGSAIEMVDTILASASYAVRSTIHKTFGISPGAWAFGRDMLLPIPIVTDLATIRAKRQTLIDENLRKENLRRRFHDYQPGDEVLIRVKDPSKLDARQIGPFVIEQVHTNGTVTIARGPNVYERINVRRLHPYHRRI